MSRRQPHFVRQPLECGGSTPLGLLLSFCLGFTASLSSAAEPKAPPKAGAKAEPTPAARAEADLDARLAALQKEGTGFGLRARYEALLAEAATLAERYAADPAAARAQLVIARCCEALGKHPEKEAAFARYIDALAATSKEAAAADLRAEAEALIARRQLFPAVKVLRLMLSKFADGPEAAYALYRLGTAQLWMEHYDEAAASLLEVVQRWPKSDTAAEARLRLARANLLQGKHAQSVDLLETVLAQEPKAPRRDAALFDLAVARYRSGDHYGALVGFQQLVREMPKSPYAEPARSLVARLRNQVLRRIDQPDRGD
jgi:TolA-binding protein